MREVHMKTHRYLDEVFMLDLQQQISAPMSGLGEISAPANLVCPEPASK
jgi:hypothetical protein